MKYSKNIAQLPNGKYRCLICDKEYTPKGIGTHMWRKHGDGQEFNPNLSLSAAERSERASKAVKIRHDNAALLKESRIENLPFDELVKSEQRIRIFNEQNGQCACCGIPTKWNGKELKFELDHISGDRSDNRRKNLRLICPNCHSQTPTYKSKNASGKRYSDEEIIKALEESESIYQALSKLGMNPHGGNYTRVRKIIKKYHLVLDYLMI